jgi:hypothetical protein
LIGYPRQHPHKTTHFTEHENVAIPVEFKTIAIVPLSSSLYSLNCVVGAIAKLYAIKTDIEKVNVGENYEILQFKLQYFIDQLLNVIRFAVGMIFQTL